MLRLENNHCHIEESEHVLKKAHKYSELIILYEKKGLHEKGDPTGPSRVWGGRLLILAESNGPHMRKRLMGLFLGFVASSAGASGPVQESKLTSERPREDGAVSAAFG